jgi:hypothetical protein
MPVNEQDFDDLTRFRPFGTEDAMRLDAQARRGTALGMALWGKTPDDLQRQLLAPSPEIPAGYDLADFQELQKSLLKISGLLRDPRQRFLASVPAAQALYSVIIVVGTRRLTALEARCEIVRRAIEYLEKH